MRASHPFHSDCTAAEKAAGVRFGTVTDRPVRLVRRLRSHVVAMPSWRASWARKSAIIAARAVRIAGFVGAQTGMSTFTVLVTVGFVTVAVVTPPAEV